MSVLTPYQTVGPFFNFALTAPGAECLAGERAEGFRITIEGIVLDGTRQPVEDALIELWQADVRGFGRCGTDESGRFSFSTIRPAAVPGPSGPQAPHVLVSVLARGVMTRLVTRIYFEDNASNASDSILHLVPPARRQTLIAKRVGDARYHFPIILQGEGETVFFDV